MPIVINKEKCTGCEVCLIYCPVEAIHMQDGVAAVDPLRCVDCYVCVRNEVCPKDAMEKGPLNRFIDQFVHAMCDPSETHVETDTPGRGTEEAKTNDVTGRFRRGEAGLAIDMGRPGVGCYLRDVEKVAMAIVKAGVRLEGRSTTPLARLASDLAAGKLHDEFLDEFFLSIIIEGKCRIEDLPSVLRALQKVSQEVDTVFSVGLVLRADGNRPNPELDILDALGISRPVRGKVNVGLGRPLVLD